MAQNRIDVIFQFSASNFYSLPGPLYMDQVEPKYQWRMAMYGPLSLTVSRKLKGVHENTDRKTIGLEKCTCQKK
jgi:hypothetical protein